MNIKKSVFAFSRSRNVLYYPMTSDVILFSIMIEAKH